MTWSVILLWFCGIIIGSLIVLMIVGFCLSENSNFFCVLDEILQSQLLILPKISSRIETFSCIEKYNYQKCLGIIK
jgi:hypothetical protein